MQNHNNFNDSETPVTAMVAQEATCDESPVVSTFDLYVDRLTNTLMSLERDKSEHFARFARQATRKAKVQQLIDLLSDTISNEAKSHAK